MTDTNFTADERAAIDEFDALLSTLRQEAQRIEDQIAEVREARRLIMNEAAARATGPEEIVAAFKVTGQRRDEIDAFIRAHHPLLDDGVQVFGAGTDKSALGTELCVFEHRIKRVATDDDIRALADGLVKTARLLEPDGGFRHDPAQDDHASDWQWVEHANGMHPVAITGDPINHRTLMLAHSTDGTEAVLLDQRGSYLYAQAGGVVASGDLVSVLTALRDEVMAVYREAAHGLDDNY